MTIDDPGVTDAFWQVPVGGYVPPPAASSRRVPDPRLEAEMEATVASVWATLAGDKAAGV